MSQESLTDALRKLGDPSGHQDQAYWDDWFRAICCHGESHRAFEWYTGPEEVLRVLSYHFSKDTKDDAMTRRIIHPGSGTSLVPLAIFSAFPSEHTVVEVSPVAIKEMKEFHEKQFLQQNPDQSSCPVDYILADILGSRSLDLESATFDAWIDKGFVDAVFSGDHEEANREQSAHLFREANRLLVSGGTVLIVTLAEKHSLEMILDNWLPSGCDASGDKVAAIPWSNVIHVWEMWPTSGGMLPYGVVLTKVSNEDADFERLVLVWHSLHGTESEFEMTRDSAVEVVSQHVSHARNIFAKERALDDENFALATLDIKPYNVEDDLEILGQLIRDTLWRCGETSESHQLTPVWQPHATDTSEMQQIIPIGFGISKLRLKCLIPDKQLDQLVMAIQDWEGDDVFEGVQSVDIDWEETIMVGNPSGLSKGIGDILSEK